MGGFMVWALQCNNRIPFAWSPAMRHVPAINVNHQLRGLHPGGDIVRRLGISAFSAHHGFLSSVNCWAACRQPIP